MKTLEVQLQLLVTIQWQQISRKAKCNTSLCHAALKNWWNINHSGSTCKM